MDSANTQEMPGMQAPQATEHHKWLAQLTGTWDGTAEMVMGPDQPPMVSHGAVHYRMLGELWLIGDMETPVDEGAADMPNVITLGYDPLQEKYVGSFISPMMTMMWVYSGSREGDKLVLDATGPDMSPGAEPGPDGKPRMVPYQDIIELVSADEHTLRSQVKGKDGSWFTFMTLTYKRKK